MPLPVAIFSADHVCSALSPRTAPLCRKPFSHDRVKKLHVEPPETDAGRDLLHRLAFAFDADTDEQTRISDDLKTWLEGRHEDDHLPLRKAWAAFKIYNKMSERRQHDKRIIRSFGRQVLELTQDAELKSDTHTAVESSLLAQISELTAANPLPPPPEPVPLDRFPAFARPAAESKEGYDGYFTPGRPLFDVFPTADPPATDKGKGKSKQPQQPLDLFINTTGNVIIPGATPSQRVVPNAEEVNNHAYHTHAPASAYVDGYGNGFDRGYGAATGEVPSWYAAALAHEAANEPDHNHASTSAYQLPPRAEEVQESLEDAIGGLRLWGGGAAAAIAQPASRAPDPAQPTSPVRRRHAYMAPPPPPSSHTSTIDDTSVSSRTDTSYARPSALRRSTVQLDGHLPAGPSHAPSAWQPANAPTTHHDATVRFDAQAQDRDGNPSMTQEAIARRQRHERTRANRQSYSSWGTVHTNDSPATRGSMSDLGEIANFPLMGQGPAQRYSMASSSGVLDRQFVSTPTQDTAPTLPLGFTAAPPAPAQRPGPAHSYSLPGNALPTLEDVVHHDPNSTLQRATHTNNRQRTVPRRFSQVPATSEFGMVIPNEQAPMDNALGLDLGMDARAGLTITAPTPRVQMGHFIRSWSLDPASR
ncbi:RING-type domain-containing protein [Mycena sanguinolenta]|uniref:RING-type domain-containing protein n=1 Tax=Mycena sanguinolenta TaxID=230812 RepID=A0A8H7CLE6_9AGAR|nr:RING-type domain-containing protein [Mycena sanguinolenta]